MQDGVACEAGEQCESGFCVDSVCCESACKGACAACIKGLTGADSGVCAPVKKGTDPDEECAQDAGQCLSGVCDGQGACGKAEDGAVCRPKAGDCDVEEVCGGGLCPVDKVQPASKVCRASQGGCDIEEVCDGKVPQCGGDMALAAGTPGDCEGFLCKGDQVCPVSCSDNSDCQEDRVCSEKVCKKFLRVFITSTTSHGDFKGAMKADEFCQARAKVATLGGTYKAWVSDAFSSPSSRFSHPTIPYVNVSKQVRAKIADSWSALIDGNIDAQILFDEYGLLKAMQSVWSGTYADGTAVNSPTCTGWSTLSGPGVVGTNKQSDSKWSYAGNDFCNASNSFYCFEQ